MLILCQSPPLGRENHTKESVGAMNDPRGSIWRKWDLHVHTPESIIHQYHGPNPWPRFLNELEQLPAEFKVIGINDYLFLDGYRRILAEKASGRLRNIDLFLPVIELRLDKFGGSKSHLSRVNYHVIFSNELAPDLIEQHFLNALSRHYTLSPQYEEWRTAGRWQALPTRKSLADLGQRIIDSVPDEERQHFASPLIEGFNNLCVSLEKISDALRSHYFEDKFITAIGKTEWASIKWNDQSIAEKKTIINGADLVFTASASVEHWHNAQRTLQEGGVNARLLDCSDAHAFQSAEHKDRLGQCLTWIKADPTFEGLRQVLVEFDERHWVGEVPPQMARVRSNPTKYIKTIEITRKTRAGTGEVWFDNSIPLNPGLIAIIGNKGKGKSALTDIIGLMCNTRQHANFTFLSSANFRQQRDNKAKRFEAILTLESGTTITKGLEEDVDEQLPEMVKYIPQNFLETICTQLGAIDESEFDRELKKVIFSHVDGPYRLGQPSLDKLIAHKAREANDKSELLKQELHRLNELIVGLEEKTTPEYRRKIANLLDKKCNELQAHDALKPAVVPKPANDPAHQERISETSKAIENAKATLLLEEVNILNAKQRTAHVVQLIATADSLNARLDNLNRQIQGFISVSQDDFVNLGLSREKVFDAMLDKGPLTERRAALIEERQKVEQTLNPAHAGSLTRKTDELGKAIKKLEDHLDEPNQRYQAYENALKAWDVRRLAIIGNKDALDTIGYYEAQLKELDDIPAQLEKLYEMRLTKAKEIHEVIRELAATYRELYAPVNSFIETRALAKEKFQLNFEVGIVDSGFLDKFFEFVSQGVSGTFCGVEAGTKTLKALLERQNFDTDEGTAAFVNEMITALHVDQRLDSKVVKVADQLRKGKSVVALYDFICALEYIKPRYALRMGTKELSELSPGERGTLLLVFYLLVDKDDIPLVIDQPEENLDNQTVFELLVPCMKEAKCRRQVFIVTHNPNLAVVCDAEQIICADLKKTDNYTMTYVSGAIENPKINRAIVDILEGTMPAFHNRQDKYRPAPI
jgi:ABC-type lipoprotein export system ATPase subunit